MAMGGQSYLGLSVPCCSQGHLGQILHSCSVPGSGLWERVVLVGWRYLGAGLGVDTTASPLSAMSSTPAQVPKPLLPSPPRTEAASQLDELLADLGHTQSKVSLGPGAAGWGAWPSPRPHHPPSRQLAVAGQGATVPTESALDNMLDSLTRDLQELGITAAPAGVCAACRKPIAGKVSPCQHLALQACPWNSSHSPCASSSQVLTALGKTWHPEHFTCAHCGRELDKGPFFEQGGRAFCEEDYHQAFSPRCAYCAGPIREVSE